MRVQKSKAPETYIPPYVPMSSSGITPTTSRVSHGAGIKPNVVTFQPVHNAYGPRGPITEPFTAPPQPAQSHVSSTNTMESRVGSMEEQLSSLMKQVLSMNEQWSNVARRQVESSRPIIETGAARFAGLWCVNCGQSGHVPQNCPIYNRNIGGHGGEKSGRPQCEKCGKLGHTADKCWRDTFCIHCQKPGHPMKVCRKRVVDRPKSATQEQINQNMFGARRPFDTYPFSQPP